VNAPLCGTYGAVTTEWCGWVDWVAKASLLCKQGLQSRSALSLLLYGKWGQRATLSGWLAALYMCNAMLGQADEEASSVGGTVLCCTLPPAGLSSAWRLLVRYVTHGDVTATCCQAELLSGGEAVAPVLLTVINCHQSAGSYCAGWTLSDYHSDVAQPTTDSTIQ